MTMGRTRAAAALLSATLVIFLGLATGAGAAGPPKIQDGGTVVVGMLNSIPGNLDPDRPSGATGVADNEVWNAMCETLYDDDAHGNTVPLLASGPMTISKDKLTMTIPLRKGIRFNDGTPFDARAVAATFNRDITIPGSARRTILGQVTSATASGPYTVELHMASPNTALLGGMTNEHIMSPTQLAKLGANFGSDPVCVGAFMYSSSEPGQSVTLVRSPYYYDKQDVHLDKLVFQYEPSDIAAAAALEAGDIQALDNVPREELKNIEDNGFRIIGSLAFGAWRIGINLGNVNGYQDPPYSNPGTPLSSSPKLREAFELAIDRKTLNRVVFGGTNVPGCTPLSPAAGTWYSTTVIPCTPYDPPEAKALVQESGMADPTVQLLFSGNVQGQILGEFVQAEEKAVGIDVVLTPVDSATLASRTHAGSYQAYIDTSSQVKADPDWIYASFMSSSGVPSNVWGDANPSLALDLDNSRKTVSDQARETLYRAAQKAIMTDRSLIYLVHVVNRAAVSSQIVGAQIRPDQDLRVALAGYKAG